MAVSVKIDVSNRAGPGVRAVLERLSADGRRQLNDLGARAAVSSLRAYHRGFEGRRGWVQPGSPTAGPGRLRTRWGEGVIRAWNVSKADPRGATITNSWPHFRQKVLGGRIVAKKAKALTIPMVPEAHGRRVADYVIAFGHVFRPKGESYLAQDDGQGGLRVVYLLRASVYQKPWKGAMPPQETYVSPFIETIAAQIRRAIDGAS